MEMECLRREQIALRELCSEQIEEAELALWQRNAELDDFHLQYTRAEEQLTASEQLCAQHMHQITLLSARIEKLGAGFTETLSRALLEEKETMLVRKVGAAVCRLGGFQEHSWKFFRRLLREYKQLVDALEHLEYALVEPEDLALAQLLLIEEQLASRAESGLLSAALKVLVDWLLAATDLVKAVKAVQALRAQLPCLAADKNRAYILLEETKEHIADQEERLFQLSKLTATISRNLKKLQEEGIEEELEDTSSLYQQLDPLHLLLEGGDYRADPVEITFNSLQRGQVLPVKGPSEPSFAGSEAIIGEETPNKPGKSKRTRCCGLRKSA
jgi:hypothetical protein